MPHKILPPYLSKLWLATGIIYMGVSDKSLAYSYAWSVMCIALRSMYMHNVDGQTHITRGCTHTHAHTHMPVHACMDAHMDIHTGTHKYTLNLNTLI